MSLQMNILRGGGLKALLTQDFFGDQALLAFSLY